MSRIQVLAIISAAAVGVALGFLVLALVDRDDESGSQPEPKTVTPVAVDAGANSDIDYPVYAIVGTRPVKVEQNEAGTVVVRAYEWDSGGWVEAPEYLTRVLFPAGDPDVTHVDEQTFERRVRAASEESRPSK